MSDETLKYKSEAIFNPDGTTGFLMVPDFENYSLTANIQHLREFVEGTQPAETTPKDERGQNAIIGFTLEPQIIVDLKKSTSLRKTRKYLIKI